MEILILDHEQVISSLSMSACICVMAEALESLAEGNVYLPLRMVI
jgi:hypothetical protein